MDFKKKKPCYFHFSDKIPDCTENPSNPFTCYRNSGDGTWAEAVEVCNELRGYLPRPTKELEANSLWNIIGEKLWTGLTTDTNP